MSPRLARALPAAVLAAGLAATALGAGWLHKRTQSEARAEFERVVARNAVEIGERFHKPTYGLAGARGIYATHAEVRRDTFRRYVATRDMPREFPGVRGFGFIQRVERADLAAFIAAERADNAPDFALRQLDLRDKPDLFVIKIIEPSAKNAGAAGLDVGSEAVRREGMLRALETGQPTITGMVTLVQDQRRSPGVLLYMPMYEQPAEPSDANARGPLRGLLYAPIVMHELLDGLPDVNAGRVRLELFADPDDTSAEARMFDSASGQPGAGPEHAARHQALRSVYAPGRVLTLRARSTPAFEAAYDSTNAWLLGLSGLFASGLLAALLRQQITGRSRAEHMARELTADLGRLALVARRTSNAVVITDTQRRITWVNEGFERVSGFSAAEAIGRSPGALLQAETTDAATVQAMRAQLDAGQGFRGELVNRSKDGRLYWLEIDIQPLHDADGRLTGFMAIESDITERKAAEAEVQRSSRLLRAAIDAIDEAFVLYDPDDRLVFCNDRYRQIYPLAAHLMVPGARFEDIVRHGAEAGEYAEAIGRVDAWVAERVARHLQANTTLVQKLSTGQTLRIVERKLPDGHIVGFRIDISELVRATEAAEKASMAKSQFLANMSHEIRTPMNAILGMLTLLRRTELNERQLDYTVKTEGAARSLLGLLNDILDFSKVEAGKMALDPQPFRFDQLMRDLGVVLSANVGTKPVEMLFDIDPSLPSMLVGDAMRLQQVLINLGGNAIKFTTEGEVVLSVQVLQRHAEAVTLRVAVRDTGIGIAPENQARIFSGFTQAEASTTRRFGGTGLGVAISQRLVALMGGELKLDSALGQGSCFHFTFTLPVAEATAAPRATPPAGLRALVVDDNPTARQVLHHMIEGLGWQAAMAASGEEALRLLAECSAAGERFDVVFMDWQMPGLDGWQTTERIRQGGLAADTPVVVMVTAHSREMFEQRRATEQAELDAYLVKPVTASMLLDTVMDARSRRDLPHLSLPRQQAAPGGAQRLRGLRLLVTEDNLNNQQVARELLEDEGAIVQLADNGAEGVAAVAAADPPFDVVLMDLQMPVMDGFTATARIRQELGQTALPIVAMTANAMASDREACLAAGMNEHVGKPFDIDRLVALLLRLVGRDATAAARDDLPAGGAPGAAPGALAAEWLAAAAAAGVALVPALQRMGGKRAVYARMLRSTVHEFEALAHTLQQPLAEAGVAGAAASLHTLKGLAATLGIDGLAQTAAAAEKALLAGPPAAQAMDTCAEVGAAVAAALPALGELAERLQDTNNDALSPSPAQPGDRSALRQQLIGLAALLEQSDMRATELTPGLLSLADNQLGPLLTQLDDAVGALDFDSAATLCRQLLEETQA